MTPSQFIKNFLPHALKVQERTGISAYFILAQAALESGWGKSIPGNMFFGVKANPKIYPENKRQLLTTSEIFTKDIHRSKFPVVISVTQRADGKYHYKVKDWFRKYDTPEECFEDHAQFFFKNKRYANALLVREEPYKFAEEVAKAGYATAPNYATSLKNMINTIKKYA